MSGWRMRRSACSRMAWRSVVLSASLSGAAGSMSRTNAPMRSESRSSCTVWHPPKPLRGPSIYSAWPIRLIRSAPRQSSHHVAGRGGVTGTVPSFEVIDDGEAVGFIDVAAVLELRRHRLDGDADAEDGLDLSGMCDRRVRHGELRLEGVELPAQDSGHTAGVVALVVDRRRTGQLYGGVVGGGDAELGVLVADGLPGRRDEGPVPGHAQDDE